MVFYDLFLCVSNSSCNFEYALSFYTRSYTKQKLILSPNKKVKASFRKQGHSPARSGRPWPSLPAVSGTREWLLPVPFAGSPTGVPGGTSPASALFRISTPHSGGAAFIFQIPILSGDS